VTSLRLPDFLVLGAAKAGTTSLARWLEAHPQVFVPPQKELHFFDRDVNWSRGVDWYAEFFTDADPGAVAGEASPAYLYVPAAAERIAQVVPTARLVALLRHPVDRAYSHYWHAHEWGGEERTFDDAVAALLRGEPGVRPYLARGYYLEQLERYEQLFGSDAMLVLRFDDLTHDPAGTFGRVCRFLGVEEVVPANVGRVYNAHSRHRSSRLRAAMEGRRLWRRAPRVARALDRVNTAENRYPPMDPALRARLLDHFAPYNDKLADHLGADLSAWSQ
jgi:hypothetical protein